MPEAPPAAAPHRPSPGPPVASVGRAIARREGPEKLAGLALFTDDLVFPGAWYGLTVRSNEAHARLLAVERDPGFDWSRVVVLTAADIPGENVVSLLVDDQPVLAEGVIRHHAEPVALVAAPDPELARAARDHVRLRTEPLAPVLDPLASDRTLAHFEIVKGDPDAALREAEIIVEETYRVGHQEQLYIEPQGMIAVPMEGGGVRLHGSLQCPYYVHTALCRALGMGKDRVVVVQAETGGGFGGKEEYPSGLAIHAAMLALRAGRPVRMIYDRHEDIASTTKRHPAIITHRTGVNRDGRLLVQDVDVVMDGGAYTTLSPVVLSRGTIHSAGPYCCPNVRIRSRAMATNTPPNGAFRGFGAPQTEFAAELQVNRVAEVLGVSPLALRRRWAYRQGDVTPTGQVLRDSVGATEVLERAVEAAGYDAAGIAEGRGPEARPVPVAATPAATGATRAGGDDPRAEGRDRLVSGVGLALGWHGAGFTGGGERHLASVAGVELTADGVVRVLVDSTEIGQGSRTVLLQMAADALGLDPDEIEIAEQDTSVVPNSGPTVASRTTMVVGGLVVRAAARLRGEVEARTGEAFARSYREDARRHGPSRVDERFEGYPDVEWDEESHLGDAYPCFSWVCAIARVDVDLDTGEVMVRSVVSADDVGRVVNPVLAAGQVEGGTLQAVGYATIEEMKVDGGRYVNDRLATYLIPTALDAPSITTVLVEVPFAAGPYGAKGLGELPIDVGAPAVVAAIRDATGVWIRDLPATSEKVLAGILAREEAPR